MSQVKREPYSKNWVDIGNYVAIIDSDRPPLVGKPWPIPMYDPWVSHDEEPSCPTFHGGQPHRMSECSMFDHRLAEPST